MFSYHQCHLKGKKIEIFVVERWEYRLFGLKVKNVPNFKQTAESHKRMTALKVFVSSSVSSVPVGLKHVLILYTCDCELSCFAQFT